VANRPDRDAQACANCGAPLGGRFCAACGQEVRPADPTLREIAADIARELSSLDGRIFRSIARLFLAPGFLTREHLQGRRARWVSPIRLYLTFSVVYFAVGAFVPEASGFRFSVSGDTEQEDAAAIQKLGFASEAELQQAVTDARHVWMPRAMFVVLPVFAWLVSRFRRASGHRFPHFLVFALHAHAMWFGAQAASGAAAYLVGHVALRTGLVVLTMGYGFGYLVLALRAVYGGTRFRAFRDALLLVLIYWAVLILTTTAIVLPAVLF